MMLEEVSSCPICQGTLFQKIISCTDHTATGEMFHVKHCAACGLGITSPRPVAQDAPRYYQSDQYISHTVSSKGLFDRIYLIVRTLTTRWKYRLIKQHLKTNGLLDYGCGTGSFLSVAAAVNKKVIGVEPSDEARKKVDPRITSYPSLRELPAKQFDVITMWHVLEHVYTLRETVRELKARLADGGVLFIAVPNHQSPDANHYASHWAAYDVPRHLWHFSKESMATFLQQEGLRVVKTIPMKLDAYYVSLLSERYSKPGAPGILRMVSAFWTAFRSNLAAGKTNHSSLIFVVQK